jgi:hypothetical protein
MVQRDGQATGNNKMPRMPFACWITKTIVTHSEYVIRIAFPWQKWLRERATMLCLRTVPVAMYVKPVYTSIYACN